MVAGPYQTTQAIKQADVVLLTYLQRDQYALAQKQANWHYYEPRTAHDSSLSPMAYALVAADRILVPVSCEYLPILGLKLFGIQVLELRLHPGDPETVRERRVDVERLDPGVLAIRQRKCDLVTISDHFLSNLREMRDY